MPVSAAPPRAGGRPRPTSARARRSASADCPSAGAGDAQAGARDRDDELTKARAALNWEKHFELSFDPDTARAYHDEDLDVDTDFCAMCGHDWCSVRISGPNSTGTTSIIATNERSICTSPIQKGLSGISSAAPSAPAAHDSHITRMP